MAESNNAQWSSVMKFWPIIGMVLTVVGSAAVLQSRVTGLAAMATATEGTVRKQETTLVELSVEQRYIKEKVNEANAKLDESRLSQARILEAIQKIKR